MGRSTDVMRPSDAFVVRVEAIEKTSRRQIGRERGEDIECRYVHERDRHC